jgi:hypothetical protein
MPSAQATDVTSFLAALGGKIADRWLSLLVLPGLLYVTAIAATVLLGQHQATDAVLVERVISAVAASATARSTGAITLIVAGILAASAVAGFAGTLAGRCIELVWTMPGREAPARLLTTWRSGHWDRARAREQSSIVDAALAAYPLAGQQPGPGLPGPAQPLPRSSAAASATARRERIGLLQPERPTWIGDRLLAADQRIHQAYGLDLASAWPALWLIIPDMARAELRTAQDSYAAAARLTGWGVLYGFLGIWWWPALPIAAVATGSGWLRGRRATAVLAQLVEVTTDLYGYSLAKQLGVIAPSAPDGPVRLNRQTGTAITELLRKDPHVADVGRSEHTAPGGIAE